MARMPVLFVGHGSPMNAIEDNEFTRSWKAMAGQVPHPKGIVMISAHWFVPGTKVNDAEKPRLVYDMYGFPDELYRVEYPAPGSPELAHKINNLLEQKVEVDNDWGFDHGNWVVLKHMYPQADIPVVQLAIDYQASPVEHYRLGGKLKALREEGYLIIGSGNIVHNLSMVRFGMEGGFDWAAEFDGWVRKHILAQDHQHLIDYHEAGTISRLAVPTPDHYYPLLYVLGAADPNDKINVSNAVCQYGSLSMTCYLFAE